MKNETVRVFGYGSLINEESLKKTAPSAKDIRPVRLYGFIRVFNVPGIWRICSETGKQAAVLNVEKSESNQHINGISFEVSKECFNELLEREKGYELVQAEVEDFFDKNSRHKVYFFRAPHDDAHPYQYDLFQQEDYMNLCLNGCKVFGEDFLDEFVKTTYIGDKTVHELDLHNKNKI